jgi:hypothetical protein
VSLLYSHSPELTFVNIDIPPIDAFILTRPEPRGL